jgi:hypothetical protein
MYLSKTPQAVLAVDRLRRHEVMSEAEWKWLRRRSRPSENTLWDHVLTAMGNLLVSVGTKLQERRSTPLPNSA